MNSENEVYISNTYIFFSPEYEKIENLERTYFEISEKSLNLIKLYIK